MKIVIKFAGALLEDAETVKSLAAQVAALAKRGHQVLVVHGGGRVFTATLMRMGIESKFVAGLRLAGSRPLEFPRRMRRVFAPSRWCTTIPWAALASSVI